jgi:hypothetical protein
MSRHPLRFALARLRTITVDGIRYEVHPAGGGQVHVYQRSASPQGKRDTPLRRVHERSEWERVVRACMVEDRQREERRKAIEDVGREGS